MADKNELLTKYSGKPYPPLEKKPQPAPTLIKSEREEYEAVVELKRGNKSPRFKIVTAAGTSYGCSYAHLLDWILEPPTLLTLNTASRIFVIEGKNLQEIERLLLDERIKELHEFDPQRHQQPEEEKTVIENLKVETG